MATKAEIERELIKAIRTVGGRYDLEVPDDLSSGTVPMGQVGGMDSLHAIELIVELGDVIPVDTDNDVFWTKSGKLRTISQAAQHLHDRQKE